MSDISLQLKFAYQNSDQKRTYTFSDIAESIVPDLKDNITAVNTSLESGTAGGLSSFFIDDNGNNFVKIEDALLTVTTETNLYLG